MKNPQPFAPQIEAARQKIARLEDKQEHVLQWPVKLAQAGLNWQEYAKQYGFNAVTISHWLHGRQVPNDDQVSEMNHWLEFAISLFQKDQQK